jgi:hypothetical protein
LQNFLELNRPKDGSACRSSMPLQTDDADGLTLTRCSATATALGGDHLLLRCIGQRHVERFSLVTNQATVLLVMAYQPSEHD